MIERSDELPDDAWTALAGSPYLAPAWFRACERTWSDLRFRYVAAFHDGRLAAVLPLHNRAGRHGMHPIRIYDPRLSRWARLFLRSASTGSPLSLFSRVAGDAAHTPALLAAAGEAARDMRCDALVAPFLEQPHAPAGFQVRATQPEFRLTLPGATFDAYLASFDSRRRWKIKKDLRAVAHLQFEVRPLAGFEHEAARLHGLNRARYRMQDAAESRFYPALAAELGEAAQIVLAREHGRIIGMTVLVVWRDTVSVLHTGSEQRDLTYFSLCFYEPIRFACARGLRHLDLRRTGGRAKTLRGAAPIPGWAGLQPLTWRGRAVARLHASVT